MEITPGYEMVDITTDPSGGIEARIGASPHGQGLVTSLSQIIADETGVDVDKISIVHGDTDRTPHGWGRRISRSSDWRRLQPLGVEIFEMPITPQRLRELIRDAQSMQ